MSVSASSQGEILLRLIVPEKGDLSPDAAHSLLELQFTDDDQQYMDELAAKARQGTLTDAERAELDNYERVNNLLGILKSKARRSLKQTDGDPA